MRHKKLFMALAAISFSWHLSAQTLHAIVFCNTNEKEIGCPIDYRNVTNAIQTICNLIDYDLNMYTLDGSKCTRAIVNSVLNEMDVDDDDVILTYYSGHGGHAANNSSDLWPQYCMNTNMQNYWLPMATLDYWVTAKKARLSIIVSDCCNSVDAMITVKPLFVTKGRATSSTEFIAANFKKLFGAKGKVAITSSKLDQASAGSQDEGGMFTNFFLKGLADVGKGNLAADWKVLLKDVAERCGEVEIRYRGSNKISHQNPEYTVLPTNSLISQTQTVSTEPTPSPTPTPAPTPIPGNSNPSSLIKSLTTLCNNSIKEDKRLAMIPGIIREYFDKGAMVITVGTDMTTQYEYEKVEDFLRRICLSPYINGVNVITESRTLLKVHEIR